MGSVVGCAARVPNYGTGTGVEICRNFIAHAKIRAKDSKAWDRGISAGNNGTEESDGICVDLEGLNLEKDLHETMQNRKDEIDNRNLGECHPIPLQA